jgi:hypothetical protein
MRLRARPHRSRGHRPRISRSDRRARTVRQVRDGGTQPGWRWAPPRQLAISLLALANMTAKHLGPGGKPSERERAQIRRAAELAAEHTLELPSAILEWLAADQPAVNTRGQRYWPTRRTGRGTKKDAGGGMGAARVAITMHFGLMCERQPALRHRDYASWQAELLCVGSIAHGRTTADPRRLQEYVRRFLEDKGLRSSRQQS